MWLLFHHNAKTRAVRDGTSFVDTCRERQRQDRKQLVEAKAVRIEDELAELKKRLGR